MYEHAGSYCEEDDAKRLCLIWVGMGMGVGWEGRRGVYPDLQSHVQVGVVGVRHALAHQALHCNRAEGGGGAGTPTRCPRPRATRAPRHLERELSGAQGP